MFWSLLIMWCQFHGKGSCWSILNESGFILGSVQVKMQKCYFIFFLAFYEDSMKTRLQVRLECCWIMKDKHTSLWFDWNFKSYLLLGQIINRTLFGTGCVKCATLSLTETKKDIASSCTAASQADPHWRRSTVHSAIFICSWSQCTFT